MRALNAQFASWVSRQKDRAPCASWEAGVADYLRHAKKLEAHRRPTSNEEAQEEQGRSKKRTRVDGGGSEDGEEDEKTSFSAKCKVFFRKVLLNARLYRGLKAKLQDKSVVLVLYVVEEGQGETGGQPQSKQTLVRLGKVEMAKELHEAIEKHTPQ
eukprot:jgi/Pico_ML_1/53263/g3835.t1